MQSLAHLQNYVILRHYRILEEYTHLSLSQNGEIDMCEFSLTYCCCQYTEIDNNVTHANR